MKIALIFTDTYMPVLFSEKTLDRLSAMGEVTHNTGKASVENVKAAIKGADIAVTSWGTPPLTAEILDSAPGLKLVIHAAGSVKPIVTDEFWKRGIRLISSVKPLSESVAETALGFTISASKNFYKLNEHLHGGSWKEHYDEVRELSDLTVGVIGVGWAGRHYIELLHNFDVDIIAYDPFMSADKLEAIGARKAEFEALLRTSDIVSVHAPSIPSTYHMFNAESLKLMKPDAILINTARGSLIDENALYEYMKAGNLKYACLDVYDPEPPKIDNPLRALPNVIMTPHLAGLTSNGKRRIGAFVLDTIKNYENGDKTECEVTADMIEKMA